VVEKARLVATGDYFSPWKRRSGATIWRSGDEKMMNCGKPSALPCSGHWPWL